MQVSRYFKNCVSASSRGYSVPPPLCEWMGLTAHNCPLIPFDILRYLAFSKKAVLCSDLETWSIISHKVKQQNTLFGRWLLVLWVKSSNQNWSFRHRWCIINITLVYLVALIRYSPTDWELNQMLFLCSLVHQTAPRTSSVVLEVW